MMDKDGIPIATVETDFLEDVDISALLVELSAVLGQVRRSAQMFAAGDLEELSVRSENLTTILRAVNEEYFVALALRPESPTGKGRYLLRINAPRLRAAIGE
ncbi:MAG: hypothetical protein HC923_09790 [Myxococcales bacterium]|nr:hypothetical protein [Myxococcales bacterium]